MATQSRLNLTRDQLASFLQDHEQIKQFERLFASVNELVPTTIADLVVNTGNADQKAVQALDALKRIADALELLATAPTATPQRGAQDDLTPPAERHNSIDYVDFNPLTPVPANVTGRVHWNGGTTLGVQMTPNVLQRVGETEFVYVKASSAITKGQLCYHTGAVGSSGVITAAPTPLSLADPNEIVGVAAESIALNGFGLIQISGDLRGFDTTGSSVGEVWADGDALYYNPAFVGSMTKVKPSAPNQKSYIGEVINAGSGGSGSMHIRIVPGSVLGGTDSNVQITGVANNDVLVYDSADQRWENKDVTTTFNLPALAANGVLYLDGSKVAKSGSALTFDGTTLNSTKLNVASAPNAFARNWAFNGMGYVSAANGNGIEFYNTTTTSYSYLTLEAGGFFNWNSSGGQIWFAGGSEQMRLTSTGLGIGTTPGEKLDSNGNIRVTGAANQRSIGFNFYGTSQYNFYVDGSSDAARMDIRRGTTQVATFDSSGNLGLGTSSFGTSAAKVLSLGSGTEPSSGPADTVQFYSVDRSAGNTIPALYCEGSGVTNAGITNTTVTHKIAMKVNGTIYYLLATTNAT